jgi:3-oxoacyl-[acyl-carrier-protein] synthase II
MLADCDIYISGMGVVAPTGIGVKPFWESLLKGQAGIQAIAGIDPNRFGRSVGGLVADFDGRDHVQPRKALKVMSRELQMGYAVGVMAMESAGIVKGSVSGERIGTVFGSEMLLGPPEDSVDTFRTIVKRHQGAIDPPSLVRDWGEAFQEQLFPLWMLKYLPNMAACHVGIVFDARGPNNSILQGDTSGLAALIEGANVIRRGGADVVIVGAIGTHINPTRLVLSGQAQRSTSTGNGACKSRPYSKYRTGYVGSEGAAAVVLESQAHLQHRGGVPLAKLRGYANCFVAPRYGTRDCGDSIATALRSLLERGGIAPEEISHIDSHAMGDPVVDLAEAGAIEQTLPETYVTAGKSGYGHTGAACGLVELVGGLLSLRHGVIPPTLHADELDPECRIRLARQPVPTKRNLLLKLSHTTQGQTIAVALERT